MGQRGKNEDKDGQEQRVREGIQERLIQSYNDTPPNTKKDDMI